MLLLSLLLLLLLFACHKYLHFTSQQLLANQGKSHLPEGQLTAVVSIGE